MSKRSTQFLKAVLSALHYTGADRLIAPMTRGNGVIFMLHHVTPEAPRAFEPNGILKITPAFLEAVITQVRAAGFEFVAMDDVPERLKQGEGAPPFAAFTLDDGYKDNRDYAYPIFKRLGVPFTIYVPSDFGDGRGDLWWLVLEDALRRLNSVTVEMNGRGRVIDLQTPNAKTVGFQTIYWWLRAMPEHEARAEVGKLAAKAGFDGAKLCPELVMSWNELRDFAKDPLVSVGAHTNTHYALAKLSSEKARQEITGSIERIEREMGRPCRHFSYPYGCENSAGEREFDMVRPLGLTTAVTTRKGLLHTRGDPDFAALPRLSLNGDFQDVRYLKVLLSGVPFAIWNAAGRIKRFSPVTSAAQPVA
jgi:peptidoglycan/xylan/chitin deacetylase (PgdA/CDA1 family)